MTAPLNDIFGAAVAANYIALNATAGIIDVLVAKGVISKSEAGAILLSIAEQTRDDAGGTSANEPAEHMVAWLEECAKVKYGV